MQVFKELGRFEMEELGRLKELTYERDGEEFTHVFHEPLPHLVYQLDCQLLIAGGDYRISQDFGIIDREDYELAQKVIDQMKDTFDQGKPWDSFEKPQD